MACKGISECFLLYWFQSIYIWLQLWYFRPKFCKISPNFWNFLHLWNNKIHQNIFHYFCCWYRCRKKEKFSVNFQDFEFVLGTSFSTSYVFRFFPQALGCILYYLCYMEHPFSDSAKLKIMNAKYTVPDDPRKVSDLQPLIGKTIALKVLHWKRYIAIFFPCSYSDLFVILRVISS